MIVFILFGFSQRVWVGCIQGPCTRLADPSWVSDRGSSSSPFTPLQWSFKKLVCSYSLCRNVALCLSQVYLLLLPLSRFLLAPFLPKSMCDSESGKVSSLVLSNLFQSHGLQSVRLLYPWDSLGKNTGMISHSLLQGIFLTQGSNPGLLHYRQTFYDLSHQGSP